MAIKKKKKKEPRCSRCNHPALYTIKRKKYCWVHGKIASEAFIP